MKRFTYKAVTWYTMFKVCREDSLGRPVYVSGYRNGEYTWTRDYLYGKEYSEKTARQHVARLTANTYPDAAHIAPVMHIC